MSDTEGIQSKPPCFVAQYWAVAWWWEPLF